MPAPILHHPPRRLLPPASAPRRRGAFTIIEMMVVIAILVILLALLVAVGTGVISSSKGRQTHATLHTLDGLMKNYLSAGNPEPPIPSPWPYGPAPAPEYVQTNPASDPINWVKLLHADPQTTKLLAKLTSGTDGNGNTIMLDAWGTAIRYVPSDNATKKEGYFESAGPDRQFLTTVDPPPAPAKLPPDDLYSTDPL